MGRLAGDDHARGVRLGLSGANELAGDLERLFVGLRRLGLDQPGATEDVDLPPLGLPADLSYLQLHPLAADVEPL